MRKLLGFGLLIAIAAWFRFGDTVVDVDYEIKAGGGEGVNQIATTLIQYHVPGVIRIFGADIYRPEGYFEQSVVKMPKEGRGAAVGALVKAMNVSLPVKLDSKRARLLGLEPEFSFWEEQGKWILLFVLLCLLYAFFWR